MKKVVLTIALLSPLLWSFTCSNPTDNPTPLETCETKDKNLKERFEKCGGNWKCYYTDSLGERVDLTFVPPVGLSSPTEYNYITFANGRLVELNYDSVQIDAGTCKYSDCGTKLTVKTNLSAMQPDSVLVCKILTQSDSYIKMTAPILGTPIRYFTMVK